MILSLWIKGIAIKTFPTLQKFFKLSKVGVRNIINDDLDKRRQYIMAGKPASA